MSDGWRLMMQGEYRRDGWGFSHRYREHVLADLIQVLESMGAIIGPPHQLVVTLRAEPEADFLLLPLKGKTDG